MGLFVSKGRCGSWEKEMGLFVSKGRCGSREKEMGHGGPNKEGAIT
jgi:hypothetical protein